MSEKLDIDFLSLPNRPPKWFQEKAEYILPKDQIVYNKSTGFYKIGDGRTKLSILQWLPKIVIPETPEPPVVSGASLVISLAVAQTIAAYLPINSDGVLADSSLITQRGKLIGLTIEPINLGDAGDVVTQGEVDNPSWSWIAGDRLFLNGTTISNTPPVSGFVQRIGTAKSSTKINIEIQEAILL